MNEPLPHGEISEPFADVFFVTGTTTPTMMGMTFQFSRNMTVIREGKDLTLVNTVRLDDGGLAKLESLGKVKHVVKLGAFHGMDDAFYVERYGATLWGLAGMTHESGRATERELGPKDAPFGGATTFRYETASAPEGLLLVDRDGGVLVACDSLQNWLGPDEFFSETSAQVMAANGFFRKGNIGPGWRAGTNPRADDFRRIKELRFRHLLSAHGVPLRDDAHSVLSSTFAELYGV